MSNPTGSRGGAPDFFCYLTHYFNKFKAILLLKSLHIYKIKLALYYKYIGFHRIDQIMIHLHVF